MWITALSYAAALAHIVLTASAFPLVTSSSSTIPSQLDTRAPTIDTRSIRDVYSSPPKPTKLEGRGPPVKLTVSDGTGKYIMLQMTGLVADARFGNFVYSAFLYLEAYVTRFNAGDLVRGGHFDWLSPPSYSLDVWNANNHQVTYGMLQMTIAAIYHYMGEHGFETATFAMFDGANQVGVGNIK